MYVNSCLNSSELLNTADLTKRIAAPTRLKTKGDLDNQLSAFLSKMSHLSEGKKRKKNACIHQFNTLSS